MFSLSNASYEASTATRSMSFMERIEAAAAAKEAARREQQSVQASAQQ